MFIYVSVLGYLVKLAMLRKGKMEGFSRRSVRIILLKWRWILIPVASWKNIRKLCTHTHTHTHTNMCYVLLYVSTAVSLSFTSDGRSFVAESCNPEL